MGSIFRGNTRDITVPLPRGFCRFLIETLYMMRNTREMHVKTLKYLRKPLGNGTHLLVVLCVTYHAHYLEASADFETFYMMRDMHVKTLKNWKPIGNGDAGISLVIPREVLLSHALYHVRCRYLSRNPT